MKDPQPWDACQKMGAMLHQRFMGLVVTKPVFGVSDKSRLKPVFSAAETSWKIEICL